MTVAKKRTPKKVTKPTGVSFYGTVMLREWMHLGPGDRQYIRIRGMINVLAAKDSFGFPARMDSGSNWVAIIMGDKEKTVILGCQIRGAESHEQVMTEVNHDVYLVP